MRHVPILRNYYSLFTFSKLLQLKLIIGLLLTKMQAYM